MQISKDTSTVKVTKIFKQETKAIVLKKQNQVCLTRELFIVSQGR